MTYDSAVLPHSLFVAGSMFDERYTEIAEKTCQFLIDNTFSEDHFSFIGCKGWFKRGGKKAEFDQQPIEAAGMVMMLRSAYEFTKNKKFLNLQKKAFGWFLGENDLRLPVYNFRTKGCHDGLMAGGVNANQGAESMLSFLLGLLSIVESYSIADLSEDNGQSSLSDPSGKLINTNETLPIEVISTDKGSEKKEVDGIV